MSRLIFILLVFLTSLCLAQKSQSSFAHVEPPFWWVGMKNNSLQILFQNKNINMKEYTPAVNYAGVSVSKVDHVENPHYVFITLQIASEAKPGMIPIEFKSGKKTLRYNYELKSQGSKDNRIQGFNSSDVIYLIMPDRFANGDTKNDSLPGMYEGVNRAKDFSRHGGDLKGISDHLPYLKDLGVTALWLNPVLENNQRTSSYHGYAITDFYSVDRRFGSNKEYVDFINNCHSQGLKVIQDMVMNHMGDQHWLMQDLPEKNWVHQFPQFTRSNYRSTVIADPYHSKEDERLMGNGWFDTTMPDLDQTNPLFATYLIQNTLWWIEYSGIDGIRMDTYPYNDKEFMARWAKDVMHQYPGFNLVGEVWINNVGSTAYWQKDSKNADQYNSHLPAVTDFPMFFTLPQALTEKGGWDSGLIRLYNLLCLDFMYPDPSRVMTFPDNHDVSRFYLLCGRNLDAFKMGLTFLLTTRGIPQLYYGTELLMDGDGGHHPDVRRDFPGGWKEDKTNAFTREGRNVQQNEAYDFLRNILNWRKKEEVIHTGKLTHYIPEDNIYVYFRHNESKTVMVILNGNDETKTIATKRFAENIESFSKARNVLNNSEYQSLENIELEKRSALVLELY